MNRVVPSGVAAVTTSCGRPCNVNRQPCNDFRFSHFATLARSFDGQSLHSVLGAKIAAHARFRKSSTGWARIWKSASGRFGLNGDLSR